jgi:hypothetical protein
MIIAVTFVAAVAGSAGLSQPGRAFTDDFAFERADLTITGRNAYFVLEPGHRRVLEDGSERLVITVLPATRIVDGVETRVVEERETKGGELVEVSRNFFAISKRTNAVYYFGEEVDMYAHDKVTSHEGSWLAGVNGAHFGLMMPSLPLLGARYHEEVAPKLAMDRAEIVNIAESARTTAGSFSRVVRVEETTPLEPGVKEYKLYAPGVGLIQDGSLKLVRQGIDKVTP